jgi:hypothetical protein
MGDARFTVHFYEPLLNIPGSDLKVVELAAADIFNISTASNMRENTITVTPQSGNETNSCNYALNEALINLDDLGVPEGSTIPSITFDNLGEADSLVGADIASIDTFGSEANDNNTIIDTQTISLTDKTLPDESFIHLYDSTPYKIVNGHITAQLPCDDDNSTGISVLLGEAPNLTPVPLEFNDQLPTSEGLCMYNLDLTPTYATSITDIAISNNSTSDIEFPDSSSVMITVESTL